MNQTSTAFCVRPNALGKEARPYDKKPYKIQLKERLDLFGMGESREWAPLLQGAEEKDPGFRMPLSLTRIEEGAFEGIDAEIVEISENVAYIGPRAFANCENLREFHIPTA